MELGIDLCRVEVESKRIGFCFRVFSPCGGLGKDRAIEEEVLFDGEFSVDGGVVVHYGNAVGGIVVCGILPSRPNRTLGAVEGGILLLVVWIDESPVWWRGRLVLENADTAWCAVRVFPVQRLPW